MFCPACGSNNDNQSRFCYRCGHRLNEGAPVAADEAPAWKDFVEPVTPEPEPEPQPVSTPVTPPPPSQVVVGKPKREFPLALIAAVLIAIAAVSGAGYGIYYGVQNVDTSSLPLIGSRSSKADAPKLLASLTSTCKDTKGQDCNLVWDLTSVQSDAKGVRIAYQVQATGQAGCSVAIEADKVLAGKLEAAGRPGPYLEGARGRYYPLVSSDGLASNPATLNCNSKQTGSWVFSAAPGESFVKLRYPGLPPARIEFSPVTVSSLPVDDPPAVIPVQASNCQTLQNQPCRGTWEIGPYGVAADGTPVVFFAVRFDGPANCQVQWEDDLTANKAITAKGDLGIRLQLADGSSLPLAGGGGLSAQNGPQNCGTVFSGLWRFAAGNLSSNVQMLYTDFPPVQLPIKP